MSTRPGSVLTAVGRPASGRSRLEEVLAAGLARSRKPTVPVGVPPAPPQPDGNGNAGSPPPPGLVGLLNDLPDDIRDKVFSNQGINCKDVARLCGLNRAFRELCKQDAFWKWHCELRGYDIIMGQSITGPDGQPPGRTWRAYYEWWCTWQPYGRDSIGRLEPIPGPIPGHYMNLQWGELEMASVGGYDALMMAILSRWTEEEDYTNNLGEDFDAALFLGFVCQNGNVEVMQALIDEDPFSTGLIPNEEEGAFHLNRLATFWHGDQDDLMHLLSLAALKDQFELVNMLLAAGAKLEDDVMQDVLNPRNQGDASVEMIKLLIAAGANVNSVDGPSAVSPLVTLSMHRYPDMDKLKVLLDAGADVNHQDNDGDSVLMRYLEKGVFSDDGSFVDALISAGADVNAVNNRGRTALMLAAQWFSGWYIETLLAAGADVYAKDNSGNTALDYVDRYTGYNEYPGLMENVLKILKDAGLKEE